MTRLGTTRLRRSFRIPLVAALLLIGPPVSSSAEEARSLGRATGRQTRAVTFVDVTAWAGIKFRHQSGASTQKFLVETMGSGCAFLDYDQDGFLDVFLVNGGRTPEYSPEAAPANALYRSRGDGTFVDVTAKTGLGRNPTYGMGVAVGDFNRDGFPDLYVTGFKKSTLYRNAGGNRFVDVTDAAGVGNDGNWATSAAWLDYDNDGDLDLVAANYLDYDYAANIYCGIEKAGYRMYCHPGNYVGVFPTLLRNNNDGTFTDVAAKAGLHTFRGKGLGVIAADFDNDGWVDIFFANDSVRNLLFHNRGNGTFKDVTFASGVGYSEAGIAEAGMGVDAADYDNDGLLDIYVTHLDFELNRLYRNEGDMSFSDVTTTSGLGRTAVLNSGFGTRFVDYDNDGYRDLFLVNGHVLDNVHLYRKAVQYAEPKMLYRNREGRFSDVSSRAGPVFSAPRVGRGLALGDYDNDGDLDALVSNNNQSAELLRNDGGNDSSWLAVRLIGEQSNRDAIGARVTVSTAGGGVLFDQVKGGGSYLSASDPRLYFGLGGDDQVRRITIHWPSGASESVHGVAPRTIVTIREGKGVVD